MFPVLRSIYATGVVVVLLVAPLASANDLRPTRPRTEPSNVYPIGSDSFSPPPSMGGDVSGNRPAMDAARRGRSYLESGQRALRRGDTAKACNFFTKARKTYDSKRIEWGVAQSEELMAKACTA